jgi:hypothetical protein
MTTLASLLTSNLLMQAVSRSACGWPLEAFARSLFVEWHNAGRAVYELAITIQSESVLVGLNGLGSPSPTREAGR